MSTIDHPFRVGQHVVITNVNRNYGDTQGTVEKIGRTRLHVLVHGRVCQFSLENRVACDAYGHETVWTPEELAARRRHTDLVRELWSLGVQIGSAALTTEQLERIVAIVKEGNRG